MIAQLCQPDAHSPPTMVARAASSSRCIGCGSNSAANSLISSAVTVLRPVFGDLAGGEIFPMSFGTADPAERGSCAIRSQRDPPASIVADCVAGR